MYKLDEGIVEFFEFEIEGKTFKFRYPSSKDLIDISEQTKGAYAAMQQIKSLTALANTGYDVADKLEKAQQAVVNDRLFLDWCEGYIEPGFADYILSKNMLILLAFVDMVQKELSGDRQSSESQS